MRARAEQTEIALEIDAGHSIGTIIRVRFPTSPSTAIMLARSDSSPPPNSPGPSTLLFPGNATHTSNTPEPSPPVTVASRKRKQSAMLGNTPDAASSPVPEQQPEGETTQTLVAQNNLQTRPRLKISRFPTFPSDGPNDYHTTDQLAMNRLNFRYGPAGISPQGWAMPCRTIESLPTSFRVSWEDRSPFVKVTADGLGLAGEKGFRSARCNAPVREGSWYMEIRVEQGGGTSISTSAERREGSHVRLGWARREAPLNGPVGLDGYSYGIRDKTGEKTTLSRPRPYGRPFGSGDVIGMYISLPPRRKPSPDDPNDPAHIKRERIAIEFKGQEYFESLEYPQAKEMTSLVDYSGKAAAANSASLPSAAITGKKSATIKNLPERGRGKKTAAEPAPVRSLPTLPSSRIAFFVNGECQGTAFQDLYDYLPLQADRASRKAKDRRKHKEGAREHKENPFDDGSLGYYPFISLFNDARIRMNPGPNFDFPPPANIDTLLNGEESEDVEMGGIEPTWRPISERYAEFMAEQWALDDEEEKEAQVEALERAEIDKAEAQKQAQKEKRRLQAEARRKAKKDAAAEEAAAKRAGSSARGTPLRESSIGFQRGSSVAGDDRLLSIPPFAQHGYDQSHSPAPTMGSNGEMQGAHSGYNSDDGVVPPAVGTPDSTNYHQRHVPQSQPLPQPRPQNPPKWEVFDMRAM